MKRISPWRIGLLRFGYLLLAVGLGLTIWPGILHPEKPWPLMYGVVQCVLAAVSLLALLGLRYPLKMLPLLMFELIWKGMWLALVGIPAWQAGGMSAGTSETLLACGMGVIFPIVIPWRYVWTNYVAAEGDRWK
jgi:hypothetical protein